MPRTILAGCLTVGLQLAALAPSALAQTPPPPCSTELKGLVVSFDAKARMVTLERGSRRDVFKMTESAAARDAKPGDQVRLQMDCSKPPQVTGMIVAQRAVSTTTGRATATPTAPLTTVLISSDDACTLSIDFKPWGDLKAGGRAELKLASGQHLLEAKGDKGRSWEQTIDVGSGQKIVEVKLGPPVATVAEYDAQAAKACGALAALKPAGQALDVILRNTKYKFHKADSAAVSAAAASWTRELARLKELVAPAERAQVTTDLSALDATVKEYAELLVKALQTAQENNTVMGEAGALRDKAQALVPLLAAPSCGAAASR